MELDHPFHKEHKLTYKKLVKRGDNGMVCEACVDFITSEHYSCGECFFFLHKSCAERPFEFTHSSHPLHPLRLLSESPYRSGFPDCSGCGKLVGGFIYHCAICKFDLDFICAFPDGSKRIHVCHPYHTLTYEKLVKRADKGVVCAACVEEITGPFADYYSCRNCNFFLHQLCFQRPLELQSPLHHCTLRLHPEVPFNSFNRLCNGCKKAPKGFVYHCEVCEFQLNFKYAFPKQENTMQRFVDVHAHPLMLLERPAKFSCDLCSSEGGGNGVEDESYVCSIPTCNFWIHKWCAFTTLTQRYKDHHQDHPLTVIQGVPEDLLIYDGIFCNVCRMAIHPTDWVSHCARCTFFVHINCMITAGSTDLISSIKDAVDYLDDSLIKLILNGDEFVHWPPKDISAELIQPFLIGKNTIVDVRPNIRHTSHMKHAMILFQELFINNDSFFEEEDGEVMCDACISPITAPYYCCHECNYYLHLPCANLPPKIKHFSHPHELIMGYQNKFYEFFGCDRCHLLGNGFAYFCETCDFSLDLTCAALPAIIMHKTHEHPLRETEARNDGACYACGDYARGDATFFDCIHCNIFLHFDCAMLYGSIRHRWDRHHPIDLKFPPHDRPRGHFMCDMCEEFIHPMYWLYSCFECEVSFHHNCVPRYSNNLLNKNLKFGGELRIRSHDHILKFLKNPTLKTSCNKCEDKIDARFVFECETCYYCVCYPCVKREMSLDETLV